MPTYEYVCECGRIIEEFQRMPGLRTMPCLCGRAARKTVGPGCGVHFKGSGFYATDYPKDGRRKDGEGRNDG